MTTTEKQMQSLIVSLMLKKQLDDAFIRTIGSKPTQIIISPIKRKPGPLKAKFKIPGGLLEWNQN